jgi:hypothetical protein
MTYDGYDVRNAEEVGVETGSVHEYSGDGYHDGSSGRQLEEMDGEVLTSNVANEDLHPSCRCTLRRRGDILARPAQEKRYDRLSARKRGIERDARLTIARVDS